MILHAELLAPTGFTTGALIKMTFFRMYDATIALCQRLKTGVTVALIKTLVGGTPTMYALYLAEKTQT
jgi:hypothetical protein